MSLWRDIFYHKKLWMHPSTGGYLCFGMLSSSS